MAQNDTKVTILAKSVAATHTASDNSVCRRSADAKTLASQNLSNVFFCYPVISLKDDLVARHPPLS